MQKHYQPPYEAVTGIQGHVSAAQVCFFNPFTGESEPFTDTMSAVQSMLRSAAKRINTMQAEIDAIKAASTWRPDVDA